MRPEATRVARQGGGCTKSKFASNGALKAVIKSWFCACWHVVLHHKNHSGVLHAELKEVFSQVGSAGGHCASVFALFVPWGAWPRCHLHEFVRFNALFHIMFIAGLFQKECVVMGPMHFRRHIQDNRQGRSRQFCAVWRPP